MKTYKVHPDIIRFLKSKDELTVRLGIELIGRSLHYRTIRGMIKWYTYTKDNVLLAKYGIEMNNYSMMWGSNNVAVGYMTGLSYTTGSGNISLGPISLYSIRYKGTQHKKANKVINNLFRTSEQKISYFRFKQRLFK